MILQRFLLTDMTDSVCTAAHKVMCYSSFSQNVLSVQRMSTAEDVKINRHSEGKNLNSEKSKQVLLIATEMCEWLTFLKVSAKKTHIFSSLQLNPVNNPLHVQSSDDTTFFLYLSEKK